MRVTFICNDIPIFSLDTPISHLAKGQKIKHKLKTYTISDIITYLIDSRYIEIYRNEKTFIDKNYHVDVYLEEIL